MTFAVCEVAREFIRKVCSNKAPFPDDCFSITASAELRHAHEPASHAKYLQERWLLACLPEVLVFPVDPCVHSLFSRMGITRRWSLVCIRLVVILVIVHPSLVSLQAIFCI